MTFADALGGIPNLFVLQDQLITDLKKIGVRGFTCTPYFSDNRPNFGDHCAWSESSAVIYLNSVIGGRSNREGGIIDIASAITGKTPNYGLHLNEERKGQILFKIKFNDWD
jgi:predicted aconitase